MGSFLKVSQVHHRERSARPRIITVHFRYDTSATDLTWKRNVKHTFLNRVESQALKLFLAHCQDMSRPSWAPPSGVQALCHHWSAHMCLHAADLVYAWAPTNQILDAPIMGCLATSFKGHGSWHLWHLYQIIESWLGCRTSCGIKHACTIRMGADQEDQHIRGIGVFSCIDTNNEGGARRFKEFRVFQHALHHAWWIKS